MQAKSDSGVRGEKPKAGSITGDLRLASLDAFLQSLNNALNAPQLPVLGTADKTLASALSVLIGALQSSKSSKSSKLEELTLTVTSKLTPSLNERAYSFSVSSKTK